MALGAGSRDVLKLILQQDDTGARWRRLGLPVSVALTR